MLIQSGFADIGFQYLLPDAVIAVSTVVAAVIRGNEAIVGAIVEWHAPQLRGVAIGIEPDLRYGIARRDPIIRTTPLFVFARKPGPLL